MTAVVLSGPGHPADLNSFLTSAFQFTHAPRLIRLGFALAKDSGVDALASAVPDRSRWERARKEWLIGIQFGLTEPEALHRLLDVPSTVIRLHGWRPAAAPRQSMFRVGSFHPKLIASGGSDPARVTALLIGSANLTGAALGAVPMNYEAAITLVGRTITGRIIIPLNQWWNRAWKESVELTHPLIDEYGRTRTAMLAQNPDLKRFAQASVRKGPQFGSALWIEARAMSGGARNQIEFAEDLAPFFGPLQRQRRLLRLRSGGQVWSDRPLAYKVTTFGVEIWRLSLPTKTDGGFDYVGNIIRFRRSTDAAGMIFDIEVSDAQGAVFRRSKQEAEVRGHIGVTGGGREYGLS